MIMNGAGMNSDIVTNGDVVANMRRACLVSNMDARAILYIGTVANGDRGHIASNNGIEPDRTFVAHCYIAHNRGVFTEVTILAPLG